MAEQHATTGSWERIFDLFHEALARPEEEREALLRARCGDDEKLWHEVTELLAAHAGEDALLDRPLVEATGDVDGVAGGPPEVPAGAVLAGRFEVIRALGTGGMASVYEAQDRELGILVALKILRPAIAADPDALSRFRKEIALARQITHPNVCRVYDMFRHEPDVGEALQFVTMELLAGESLAERIRRDGPLSPDELRPIAEQIVAALEAAHGVGVVHRDLKPGNVMLVPEEESGAVRAVVADFGLAVSLGADAGSRVTRAGQLIGTPAYMAPEQLVGDEVTAATDIYSFGLLLFEALTGELPFAEKSPLSGALRRLATPSPPLRTRIPELPRVWERTVMRCLRRDPGLRFASVAEVEASLRGEAIRDRSRRVLRHRWLAATVVLLAALAGLAGFGYWRSRQPKLPFDERDWLLIGRFENRTGESVFDGTVEYTLEQELSNSRFVNVVPRQRIDDALHLMEKPAGTPIDREVGRQICLRDGGIRAFITGRVQKLGDSYVLGAQLVNPENDVTVASFRAEADGRDQVAAAVRELADRVRGALGEDLAEIGKSEQKLAKVTTPSLRALHLFTQADAVIARSKEGNVTAEQLLREAIAEDPQFASAYMHLAHALRNQGRPPEEYQPYAKRALELSKHSSERERYFILGSYYSMMGETEKSIDAYRTLVQLYPNDFWGTGNLAHALDQAGRPEEALGYWRKAAESRPHNFFINVTVGYRLVNSSNDPRASRPYLERARSLLSPSARKRAGFYAAWLELYPFCTSWKHGRLDEALTQANQISKQRLDTSDSSVGVDYRWEIGGAYLALGRLRTAESVYRQITDPRDRAQGLALVAWARGDARGMAESLRGQPPAYFNLMLLARAGFASQAEAALYSPQESVKSEMPAPPAEPIYRAALGHLALARGRTAESVEALEKGAEELRGGDSSYYFMTVDALADAGEAMGDRQSALTALETASRERPNLSEPFLAAFWMRTEAHRARLLRRMGRASEAEKIEANLRGLLALADPDVDIFKPLSPLEKNAELVTLSASSR